MVASVKRFLRRLGPGIIAGAAADDAGAIATFSIAGALAGYSLLWLVILIGPALFVVQEVCARLGTTTRLGLARLVKEHYGMPFALLVTILYAVAAVGTLAAELAGATAALELITGIRRIYFLLPLTAIVWYLLLFKNMRVIQRYLIPLTFILAVYIVAGIMVNPNWQKVLNGVIRPSFAMGHAQLAAALAMIGTTIAPYLFFWQTEAQIEQRRLPRDMIATRLDVGVGVAYTVVVAFFIVVTTGSTLLGQDITSAAQAAQALDPVAGPFSRYLFAVGLLGASVVAIPVLASTISYAVSAVVGWRASLAFTPERAKGFYMVFTIALLIAMAANVTRFSPIHIMYYSQIVFAFITPVLLILVMLLSRSKNVMGEHANGWFVNITGWLTATFTALLVLLFLFG